MARRLTVAFTMTALLALAPPTAVAAERADYPHEFHHNMGYCAPYLAQLRLPDGSAVRPFVNHLIQDLTAAGAFEGQKNLGDLYSDRARDELDQLCLARP